MPNALDTDSEEPVHAYYACEHGKSNSPCYCHLAVNKNARPMPENWYEDMPPGAGGLTDSVGAGGAGSASTQSGVGGAGGSTATTAGGAGGGT